MNRPKEWTWRTRKGRTHIVRENTDAAVRDARAKTLGAHRAYRLASDHVYIVTDIPSIGESLDVLIDALDRAAHWSQGPRGLRGDLRHALAALALIALFILPLGAAQLIATGYTAWLSTRANIAVVDMRAEAGLSDEDSQAPGEWT